jgi:hypothetical protein
MVVLTLKKKWLHIISALALATACVLSSVLPMFDPQTYQPEFRYVFWTLTHLTHITLMGTAAYLVLYAAYWAGAKRLEKFVFSPYVKTMILNFMIIIMLVYYAGLLPLILGFDFFTSDPFEWYQTMRHVLCPAGFVAFYVLTPNVKSEVVFEKKFITIASLAFLGYVLFVAAYGEIMGEMHYFGDPLSGQPMVIKIGLIPVLGTVGLITAWISNGALKKLLGIKPDKNTDDLNINIKQQEDL